MRIVYVSLILLLTTILGACSLFEKEPETSVFYSPHADDETLSLGPSILRQIDKGNEVAVVLLSHGEASQSIKKVNEKLKDKDLPAISKEEFGNSRVKEFKKSVEELGVNSENVYIYDLPDGDIEKEDVMKIMKEMNKRYPDARHHALSYNDAHRDHAASGAALKELADDGTISSALFYLPVQEFENMEYDDAYPVPDSLKDNYKKSLAAYRIWKPEEGLYSIGYTSVKPYFVEAGRYGESRWHR
ncbi:PIG-L family deacetylase [Bacillus sp. es.034]|uniref:PIG-L family deacetylase n=1 Tax=Bacillus sp. es.034 TaxID=1761763 RepID=UPI000BF63469|nr:PIG-L family deacetylase [Bacillus sp. es.034]PFG04415.1 GlcNAc-PI de-N-acetylase [Bacillus sp. es.034]